MRTADAAVISPKSREKGGSGDTPVPTTVPHWSSGARVTASGDPVVLQSTPWSLQPGWSPPFRLLHGPRRQKSQRVEASPVAWCWVNRSAAHRDTADRVDEK